MGAFLLNLVQDRADGGTLLLCESIIKTRTIMNERTKSGWKIDPGHSAIQFSVKHLAIANIAGSFTEFAGDVHAAHEDFDGAQVNLTINTNSVNTNNGPRDADLKSEAFFEVARFPAITFAGILHKLDSEYELVGQLTIRDITKTVTLATEFLGTGKGRFGDARAGFELTGRINRKEFGLSWSMLTEAGGLIVGEQIKLQMSVELIKE